MRRINRCLNPQLALICQKVIQLDNLNILLQNYLPNHLWEHCKASNLDNDCLTLSVRNTVWATELRYSTGELRDKLRKGGFPQLRSIKILVDLQG